MSIFPVDPKACDELTRFRLGASRPEFIYGIELDDQQWGKVVGQVCQPRSYSPLRRELIRDLRHCYEEYFLVDHALIHLREHYKGRKRPLRLVSSKASCPLAAFCGAVFGIHQQNLRREYFEQETVFSDTTATAFASLVTEFVSDYQQSWLDVTGHELSARIEFGWSVVLPPTVVLVEHPVQDLGLFWNLRSGSDATHPVWIIPIPVQSACNPDVLGALKEWLLSFLPYGSRPNYCRVTSQTVSEYVCQEFARAFQTVLAGSPIEFVDYAPPRNRLPIVIPYEYETVWPVNLSGRRLTMQPPRPKAFEDVGSPRGWIVDLVADMGTGRALKELQLPPSLVAFELLNGPCPPSFEHSAFPRTGDGVNSINVRCSGRKDVIRIHLPSGEEILEETLREHGAEPIKDEKRSSYLPVIRKFGGLYRAAAAFTGKSGLILATLQDKTKTVPEIKGACQLGSEPVSGKSYLERIEWLFQRESERTKRVGQRRFSQSAGRRSPENLPLSGLLEHWADRTVLTREWKIGPCSECGQVSFVPRINIQRRVVCVACGNRISLAERVPLGYALHRTVRHAMKEGIVPVVLTGRFLRNMTNKGFLWLPGVKYQMGEKSGDIDLIACCDADLAFCECKQLDNTPPGTKVWQDVVTQFRSTVEIAKRCRASLVVLAAMAEEFPKDVSDQIAAEIGSSIPWLLLTKKDLEKGHRNIESENRRMALYDLIPLPFPERPGKPVEKPRTITG